MEGLVLLAVVTTIRASPICTIYCNILLSGGKAPWPSDCKCLFDTNNTKKAYESSFQNGILNAISEDYSKDAFEKKSIKAIDLPPLQTPIKESDQKDLSYVPMYNKKIDNKVFNLRNNFEIFRKNYENNENNLSDYDMYIYVFATKKRNSNTFLKDIKPTHTINKCNETSKKEHCVFNEVIVANTEHINAPQITYDVNTEAGNISHETSTESYKYNITINELRKKNAFEPTEIFSNYGVASDVAESILPTRKFNSILTNKTFIKSEKGNPALSLSNLTRDTANKLLLSTNVLSGYVKDDDDSSTISTTETPLSQFTSKTIPKVVTRKPYSNILFKKLKKGFFNEMETNTEKIQSTSLNLANDYPENVTVIADDITSPAKRTDISSNALRNKLFHYFRTKNSKPLDIHDVDSARNKIAVLNVGDKQIKAIDIRETTGTAGEQYGKENKPRNYNTDDAGKMFNSDFKINIEKTIRTIDTPANVAPRDINITTNNDSKRLEYKESEIPITRVITHEFPNDTVITLTNGTEAIPNNDFLEIKNNKEELDKIESVSFANIPTSTYEALNSSIIGRLYFVYGNKKIPASFAQQSDGNLQLNLDITKICDKIVNGGEK